MTSEIVGCEAKRFPLYTGSQDSLAGLILLTVLVRRIEGTVKAYAGLVPDTSQEDPNYREASQWVRRFGNPLRYDDVKAIWPDVASKEYAA